MSETITTGTKQEENGNYVEVFICRLPKKNHDAMVQLYKQTVDTFKKYGILHWEIFQLSHTEENQFFTNIAKIVSANQDEEKVWIDIVSYKNKEHKDEIMAKMEKDKECQEGYQQFLNLLTPGSSVINGELGRLSGVGF